MQLISLEKIANMTFSSEILENAIIETAHRFAGGLKKKFDLPLCDGTKICRWTEEEV